MAFRPTINNMQDFLVGLEFVTNAEAVRTHIDQLKTTIARHEAAAAKYAKVERLEDLEAELKAKIEEQKQRLADVSRVEADAKQQAREIIAEAKKQANEITKVDKAARNEVEKLRQELTAKIAQNEKTQTVQDQLKRELDAYREELKEKERAHEAKVQAFYDTLRKAGG